MHVPRIRLRHHGLATPFDDAAAVVAAFGAVQAQDYPGSLWGIAQRTQADTERDVEKAIAERKIVRSWPMRGTLHFVDPSLLRSMLAVLAPRIVRRAARRYEELGLDAAAFKKSRAILERSLRDGPRTRNELYQALARGKVDPNEQRGIHILGRYAMEGLICLATRRAKQFTFALLDDWLPPSPQLDDDALLAELVRRYFATHGPATANDFAWWTGLALGEARRAIESAKLTPTSLGDRTLYGADGLAAKKALVHLLPAWDEYTVGYRDRSDIVDESHASAVRGGVLSPVIAIDGEIVATWTRKTTKTGIAITARAFTKKQRIDAALQRYAAFANAKVTLAWQ